MSRVMIIGAGGVGSVVAHKCAALPEVFSDIILASRNEEKCKAIARHLDGSIRTTEVDADDPGQLTELLEREQPFLVINVALPYQDLSIMDACLATGVHYIDTANYEPRDTAKFEYKWQWNYRDRFEKAGLTAVLGSGFDPGATNAFVAWAARHEFDEIYELDIIDVNGGEHGHAFATNFNPEINIREITAECRAWSEGRFISSPPLSNRARFACPDNMGSFNVYQMYHEELESLTLHYPKLRRACFWMSFSEDYLRHLEVLSAVGMTGIEPIIHEGHPVVPVQFLKSLLPDPAGLGASTTGKTCIGCVITGVRKGKEKTIYIYNISDHQACYLEIGSQAISYTTGVPAMIGAKMIVEGKWRVPGVWNIEQLDPDPYLADFPTYGLPWMVRELDGISLQPEMVNGAD
jgi:saccharopine dehydrogenase (NAD+, L-lysine-forming)